MKEIQVDMYAFHGIGCGCRRHSSSEIATVEISYEAAATLEEMQKTKREPTQNDVLAAIKAGHTELQPLYDTVRNLHTDMVVRYWLFEADNECLDENLEPYFWQDIESKLYKPEVDRDEFVIAHQDDEDFADYDFMDEDDVRTAYYEFGKADYLAWVNGHTGDYSFVAERIGLDLDAVYSDIPELDFTITTLLGSKPSLSPQDELLLEALDAPLYEPTPEMLQEMAERKRQLEEEARKKKEWANSISPQDELLLEALDAPLHESDPESVKQLVAEMRQRRAEKKH